MLYIILAGIVVVFTAVCALLAIGAPRTATERTHSAADPEVTRGGFLTGALIGAVVLALMTVMFSMTIVSARTVGVYTEFGKEAGPARKAGIGWTRPWVTKAQEMPTNVQYLVMDGNEHDDDSWGPTQVNYRGGGHGEVDATVRWSMDPDRAIDLWRKYRQFERVTDQLVRSAAKDSIGVTIGAYTPNDARDGEKRRTITEGVVSDLNRTLAGNGIRVDSVSITDVRLDPKTQQSVEAIIKANADLQRALVEQKRAVVEAQTAKTRQASGSLSPGALTRYCLELTNSWSHGNNGDLPTTWNCFPGANSAGVLVGR